MSHFPQVARALDADAVQLGISDPPVAEVRRLVGQDMAIGYSSHSIEEARLQLEGGADYVFLGPVFATPAKLKYGEPLGLEVARQAVAELNGIIVCIGGISNSNLPQLVAAGVSRVAAIAALQKDCDPAHAVREFRQLLEGEGVGPSGSCG
jgi:thiamine-phosphate pyrophosphorylase